MLLLIVSWDKLLPSTGALLVCIEHVLNTNNSIATKPAQALWSGVSSVVRMTLKNYLRPWVLPGLAVLLVAVVYAPTLNDYFHGDDFPDFADVAHKGAGKYLWDILSFHSPSLYWRFFTRVIFLGEYQLWGLNSTPYHVVNLALHLAIVMLTYRLTLDFTGRRDVAFIAALWFGVTATHVVTVAWVTALNRLLHTFFFLLSLWFLLRYLVQERIKQWPLMASLGAFLMAILADEVSAFFAVILAIYAWLFYFQDRRDLRGYVLVVAPYILLGLGAGITLYILQSDKNYLQPSSYGLGWHIWRNLWAFLGRSVFPIKAETPREFWLVHRVLGATLLALGLYFVIRGPRLGRFLALWMLLALLPFTPTVSWSPARYTYLASIPFAVGVSCLMAKVASTLRAKLSPIPVWLAVGSVLIAVLVLLSRQTMEKNNRFALFAERYRILVEGLQEELPEVGPNSRIYIVNGIWNSPFADLVFLPAVAETLYDDAHLRSLPPDPCKAYLAAPGAHTCISFATKTENSIEFPLAH